MNEQQVRRTSITNWLSDTLELLHLSLKLQLGKRFYLYPLLPLLWLAFRTVLKIFGIDDEHNVDNVQNLLIGTPIYFLAIAIGMQIISSEIEHRTLEVCYTVPGGAKRIWIAKMSSGVLLLLAASIFLALYTYIVFTAFPLAVLYRVMQGGIFYLVLSMAFGALFKNKMTAGMASIIFLLGNAFLSDVGVRFTRFSPLFNPMNFTGGSMSNEEILYWIIQNHIGFALIILTLTVLTFSRAERRELLLSDD